jgi:predicted dienelactone hydrolase
MSAITRSLTAAALTLWSLAGAAQVGMTEWHAGPLPVTLVYPTQAQAKPFTSGPFTIDVALNAPAMEQRQRLIVMSHGTGGETMSNFALASTLARAGFVVAQPLHNGDNFKDTSQAGPPSFERRPSEVSQVIDALAADPQWSKRLDLSKVGVHGMSAGGVTGLSLAGAQWRMLDMIKHCNANLQADIAFCFNGATQPSQQAERLASYEKTKGAPELLLPANLKVLHGGLTPTADNLEVRPDSRVASVTLSVPLAVIFTQESLARIRIPVGVVGVQRDEVLAPQFHSKRLLSLCSTCSLLADLPGAGHFDLLWPWP